MNARIDLSLSRREFLNASGALVVSAAGPAFIGETLAQTAAVSTGGKPPLVPSELDSWVAILPDGRVTAFFGKMDMGQSLDIAIAQIVADELDVDVAKVDVVMGDTALTCNQGGASGSTGIQTGARPLRSAAAEARRLLVQSASQKLGLPVEQLRVDDGVVSAVSDPAKKAGYAELIGGSPSFCEADCTSRRRASAAALRKGRAPVWIPVLPEAPPWLQVSAVSPMTTSTLATSTSSSSATICAIAMSRDWPMSILPKKALTRPLGRIATQESSSLGRSGGLLPGETAAVCASVSPVKAGPAAETTSAPEAFRNSRRESDRSMRAFMSFS